MHFKTQPRFPSRWPSPDEMRAYARARRKAAAKRMADGSARARAQALVREQLRHGPRPEASIMAAAAAAEISERLLIVAASMLGVRTQKGRWWLPELLRRR
jgi:hypothetical protein